MLLDASRAATPSETTPVVLADAGVENVNAQVDDLITTGVLRRVLAFTDLKFSNSMIEVVALAETSVTLPPLAGQRHHRPSTGRVLRRRTQPRPSAFGVSGTDVGRDVFWHRARRAGRLDVPRGRCTPGTRYGQPIGGLRDVHVSRGSRLTTEC